MDPLRCQGVHASRTVVSGNMLVPLAIAGIESGGLPTPLAPGALDGIVHRMNAALPPDIRCWGVTRTPRSFQAREACSWREYEYVFPASLLLDDDHGGGSGDVSNRPSRERRLREALAVFEGAHSFHNFTVRKGIRDGGWPDGNAAAARSARDAAWASSFADQPADLNGAASAATAPSATAASSTADSPPPPPPPLPPLLSGPSSPKPVSSSADSPDKNGGAFGKQGAMPPEAGGREAGSAASQTDAQGDGSDGSDGGGGRGGRGGGGEPRALSDVRLEMSGLPQATRTVTACELATPLDINGGTSMSAQTQTRRAAAMSTKSTNDSGNSDSKNNDDDDSVYATAVNPLTAIATTTHHLTLPPTTPLLPSITTTISSAIDTTTTTTTILTTPPVPPPLPPQSTTTTISSAVDAVTTHHHYSTNTTTKYHHHNNFGNRHHHHHHHHHHHNTPPP
jgi:hypothetical protein